MSQLTVPRYGDVSAGVQLTATPTGMPLSIHGYVVTFAYRGLVATVIVMSMADLAKEDALTVVSAAEKRIRTAS